MEEILKPEVTITSFEEKAVNEYINKIERIIGAYGETQPILLKIDSYGGSIYGLAHLYEYLSSLNSPIVTYTASKAMSAGAILLSAAAKKGRRMASPNSSIMIHEIQCGTSGDIKNVENEVEHLKVENEKWMNILAKSMGMKSSNDIRKLLNENSGHELYLTAEKAKKLGIVDEVSYLRMVPVHGWDIVTDNKTEVKKCKKQLDKQQSPK